MVGLPRSPPFWRILLLELSVALVDAVTVPATCMPPAVVVTTRLPVVASPFSPVMLPEDNDRAGEFVKSLSASFIYTLPLPVVVAVALTRRDNCVVPLLPPVTMRGVPLAPMLPFVAVKEINGDLTAALPVVAATMPPAPLTMFNNAEAFGAVVVLFKVNVSAVAELSVIHALPCPTNVPVADANKDTPAPPLLTKTRLVPEVPISPFVAVRLTLGLTSELFVTVMSAPDEVNLTEVVPVTVLGEPVVFTPALPEVALIVTALPYTATFANCPVNP